jgi:hypothetical protein
MSREWLLWLSSRVADAMIEALDDRWPSSIAVDRSFLTSRCIATLRDAAVPPTSRDYWAAARGGDDAKCCRQRCERIPPGSPKGVAGEGAPARAGLKWCSKFRPSDLKRNVTPDAPRCRCWPTRAVEAGRDQSGQPDRIASFVDGGVSPVRERMAPHQTESRLACWVQQSNSQPRVATLALTCCRKRERSGRWRQSGAALG